MVAYTTLAVAAAVLGFTNAAPSSVPLTGVVHRITAGSTVANAGLHFEPENVFAEIGDRIEFHFLPKNHAVVQSSFDEPCKPIANNTGIFSGFNFATTEGEAPNVFTFVVENKDPFWYYCPQTKGDHCQNGMSGVINQNPDSGKTLAKYKDAAAETNTVPLPDVMATQGGSIIPRNPDISI